MSPAWAERRRGRSYSHDCSREGLGGTLWVLTTDVEQAVDVGQQGC